MENGDAFKDSIVVITGGTRGIGRAVAKKFLSSGAKVVTLGRHKNEESLRELESLGEVSFITGDVSKAEDCERIVKEVISKYGRIDVLVNVAGVVGERKAFTEVDLKDVVNTININLMGTIYMSHFTAKEMIKARTGVIVNIGSICGHIVNHEAIGYHASKGGVVMATRAMARELSPYGIRAIEVAPAWVHTGMIADIGTTGGKLHMKGRIIEPEEIANVVWLVALPEASAINGSTVMADDGYASFKGIDGFKA